MLKVFNYNNDEINIEVFNFPAGEVHFKLPENFFEEHTESMLIETDLAKPHELMLLAMLVDKFNGLQIPTTVDFKYLPYGRQDRLTSIYEPFSFRTFAKIVNGMGIDMIIINDPHSDVSPALLEDAHVNSQDEIVFNEISDWFTPDTVLIAPDAGALKKIGESAKRFRVPYVVGMKVRDTMTGAITGTRIDNGLDLNGKDLIIIDDICDGGRTFIELSKVIYEEYKPKTLKLFTTVGIYSKGIQELEPHFTEIKCFHKFER